MIYLTNYFDDEPVEPAPEEETVEEETAPEGEDAAPEAE